MKTSKIVSCIAVLLLSMAIVGVAYAFDGAALGLVEYTVEPVPADLAFQRGAEGTCSTASPTGTGVMSTGTPPPAPALGTDPNQTTGGSVNSLSGSFVEFDPATGGDTCYIGGSTHTFCFEARSYTNDWAYAYNTWLKFPTDWTVSNVYVQGTPTCTSGGTFGTFSWSFQTSPYEVNIAHPRYMANPADNCVAYYCVDVVAGAPLPGGADESWYWDGDGYGSAPHNPCSDDVYTPAGQNACDQSTLAQANVPTCALDPGIYLLPAEVEGGGCNGVPQDYTLQVFNNSGSSGTINLDYAASQGATLTGPATVSVNDGEAGSFDVAYSPEVCLPSNVELSGWITATGFTYTDVSTITYQVDTAPSWAAVPASAPTWAGGGYPRDGCTAQNAAGDWVTYLIGDMSTISGFWGYNIDTNTWFNPAPTGLPADRWAPDWAYDPDTNLCYVTGGANTPGGGTYAEAYVYDPVANAFTALGSFTSARDFHNSWVGTIDGVNYLCIGGGTNAAGVMVQATQCYDLSQAAPGVWNAENAQMAAFPTDPFGAADGTLYAPTGDQFWYVGGAVNAGASITDEARYWDDADNSWHLAGNTGAARYRVEGDFFNGAFYQIAGSSGGFTPTTTAVRGTLVGSTWVWTALPDLANARMDNVVAVTDDNVYSLDGYGANASAYVEYLQFCPACTEVGTLDGHVYDYDGVNPTPNPAWVNVQPGDLNIPVDPATGYYNVDLAPWEYEITANATGYPAGDGPYIIQVVDGFTTTQNFVLDRPDIDVDPTLLSAAADAPNTVTEYFTITNEGTLDLDYEIQEVPAVGMVVNEGGLKAIEKAAHVQPPLIVGIDPQLADAFSASPDGQVGFFIAFRETADLTRAYTMNWTDRGRFVVEQLQATAERTQVNARTWLERQGIEYTSYWINNSIYVYASQATMQAIYDSFPEVSGIRASHTYEVMPVAGVSLIENETMAPAYPWNITFPMANLVHSELGITGEGVVIGGSDTGVLYTHVGLVENYRGNNHDGTFDHTYSWYDPESDCSGAPCDNNGHGTATMGIMAGDDDPALPTGAWIGMAPDAEWIHCLACPAGSCPDTATTACAQWFLAPGGNPDMRPDVVNHSWGLWSANDCNGNDFQTELLAYRAADILPAFAAGNVGDTVSPLNCWASTSPANNVDASGNPLAFSSGAHGPTGTLDSYSSGGPSACNNDNLFPDVASPGQGSCTTTSSGGYYCGFGGTSSASPHTTGCAALVRAAAPWLSVAEVEQVIRDTATDVDDGCGTPAESPDWNNKYGEGLLNCYAAVSQVYSFDIPWVTVTPISGTLGAGGSDAIQVDFTCSITDTMAPQPLTGQLRISHNDPTEPPVTVGLEFYCTGNATYPMWDKEVYINSMLALPVEGPHVVRSGDEVMIVDYVGASFSGNITATLTETWGAELALVGYDTGGIGTVDESAGTLIWNLDDVAANIMYPITKTFEVQYGEWLVSSILEEFTVENQGMALPDVTVDFEHYLAALTLDKYGPETALDGDTINVTLEVSSTNFYGTAIITDALPVGMIFAGNLTTTYGTAWYDSVDNAVYWTNGVVVEAGPVPQTTTGSPAHSIALSLAGTGDATTNAVVAAPEAAVEMILDDGSRENDIGLGGTIEMLWVNRFTPDPAAFPFGLNQIQVYFSTVGLVNVGDDIVLVVYENTSGNTDPAVGANLLATFPTTVQAVDAWSVYNLATPVALNGPGDVIIGVIGMETPGTNYWPASMDQTATQARSWAGWWNASPPPEPPTLPPPTWTLIDAYFPGNWMVRGYGDPLGPPMPSPVTITFDVVVEGNPGDVIVNHAVLNWGTDWTDDILAVEILGAPVASFTADALICAGVETTFVNTSDPGYPPATDWVWDFDDGTVITTTFGDVTHTFAAAGDYTVTLEACNVSGCDTAQLLVSVGPLPVADFTYVADGATVDFTNTSTDADTYLWDFGDGVTSTLVSPSHIYAAAGDYDVTLIAYNDCGMDEYTVTITITIAPEYLRIWIPTLLKNPTP